VKQFEGPDGTVYVWGRVIALGAPTAWHSVQRKVRWLLVEGNSYAIWDTPENLKAAGIGADADYQQHRAFGYDSLTGKIGELPA
jgi:hypothetical protein